MAMGGKVRDSVWVEREDNEHMLASIPLKKLTSKLAVCYLIHNSGAVGPKGWDLVPFSVKCPDCPESVCLSLHFYLKHNRQELRLADVTEIDARV